MSDDQEFLTMTRVPVFIWERRGLKISLSTVHKLWSPSRGEGPAPDGHWGRQPIYKPTTVLEWADARVRQRMSAS